MICQQQIHYEYDSRERERKILENEEGLRGNKRKRKKDKGRERTVISGEIGKKHICPEFDKISTLISFDLQ